ncbi:hypothetical protein GCM10009733_056780 [Nonomuraea maheshkhaliensis]|uniref:Uncharacterized protein n=1 Tax=Nonomuraea maheshkhaliensis TaxID=419590 RepID=A0ABN2FL81_9ACTN
MAAAAGSTARDRASSSIVRAAASSNGRTGPLKIRNSATSHSTDGGRPAARCARNSGAGGGRSSGSAGSPACARAHAALGSCPIGELDITVSDRTRSGACTPSHCAIMPPKEAPAT